MHSGPQARNALKAVSQEIAKRALAAEEEQPGTTFVAVEAGTSTSELSFHPHQTMTTSFGQHQWSSKWASGRKNLKQNPAPLLWSISSSSSMPSQALQCMPKLNNIWHEHIRQQRRILVILLFQFSSWEMRLLSAAEDERKKTFGDTDLQHYYFY